MTALITGASSGIGKELAYIHGEKGGDLILVARSKEKLEDLKRDLEKKYSNKVTIIVKDLSIVGSAKELYDEVKDLGIDVDYLINNAGFGLGGKFHQLSLERQQEMMNLNMFALTELTHMFLQDFTKRNSGKILNVSSTASFMPGPLQAVYFASKSYVQFLSNALSEELIDTNITVTNLMPSATETEFAKVSGMEKTELFSKMATAKDVALDGYNGMLEGKLDVLSGLQFSQKLLKTFMAFIPKKILLKEVRKMQESK
ncbi:MAG: SDR family oxidoreductase [Campylobacterales bacterium]|nr:SDR family oxidoreductase [Campylobacterales bacterium]